MRSFSFSLQMRALFLVHRSLWPVTLSLASKKYHFAWYSLQFTFVFVYFWVYIGDRIFIKNHCCCMTCIVIPIQTARSMFSRKMFCMKESFECREVFHCCMFNVHTASHCTVKELINNNKNPNGTIHDAQRRHSFAILDIAGSLNWFRSIIIDSVQITPIIYIQSIFFSSSNVFLLNSIEKYCI